VQQHQTVSEMAEEALMCQAKSLTQRSGCSLEDAREAVSDTEACRQLRGLAKGDSLLKNSRAPFSEPYSGV
jgi:hypothetical protein